MDFSFSKFSAKNKKNAENKGSDNLNAKNKKEKAMKKSSPEEGCTLKVVLIGDTRAGKTNFVTYYIKGTFLELSATTIGASFLTKNLVVRGNNAKVHIWDVSGHEIYTTLAPMYFRGADGVIFGYDITSRASFEKARWWNNFFLSSGGDGNAVFMLVGYKADLEADRQVSYSEGETFAREIGASLFFESK